MTTHKTHIVLHHSTTADGKTLSAPAIRQTHLDKGWDDVGYHGLVELFDRPGDIAPSQLLMVAGRPLLARAAGEWRGGFNRKGVHICCVGDFDLVRPSPLLWRFLAAHLSDLMDALGIPVENVIGHREIQGVAKSCPGEQWDMDQFRELLGGWP